MSIIGQSYHKWGAVLLVLFVSGIFVSACSFETSLSGLECGEERATRSGEVCRDGYWRVDMDAGLDAEQNPAEDVFSDARAPDDTKPPPDAETPDVETPDVPQCAEAEVLCSEECVDLWSDPLNCGACGTICPSEGVSEGVCVDGGCRESAACDPGDARPCYTGDPATRDEGRCEDGEQTCEGGQWSECVDEILPQPEMCNGYDDDCNGVVDDGVPNRGGCTTGEPGLCGVGVETCIDGDFECVPLHAPAAADSCGDDGMGTDLDENCNGVANEGCAECVENATKPCYQGQDGTAGTGLCAAGERRCTNGEWSSCEDQVLPAAEVCDAYDHDCDGNNHNGFDDVGEACVVDEGQCANGGIMVCKPDGSGTMCGTLITSMKTYYPDADEDGHGSNDASLAIEACERPEGYVENNTDCDDADPDTYPGASEQCNGKDNSCSGHVDDGGDLCGDSQICEGGSCCDTGAEGSNRCARVLCGAPHGDGGASCASGYCESIPGSDNDICLPAHCGNNKKDGDETRINCGGSCLKCNNSSCDHRDECKSNRCGKIRGRCW